MRKVEYPTGTAFEQAFLDVFKSEHYKMQKAWDTLQKAYPAEIGHIPADIDLILKASFADLVYWFNKFKQLSKSKRDELNPKLTLVFNYEHWSSDIADYFKNPKNGFKLTSCHYCDMAYINAFEVDPDADALYFLNNADDDELQKITKSPPRINYVKAQRPYKHKADFDKVVAYYGWSANKWNRTFRPNYKYRHHFDLDHVLPKSVCGLVGLSLYNFVPSCQICNQKLKRFRVLGVNGVAKEKLSPSSPLFDFEKKAEFHIKPKAGIMAGMLCPTLNTQDYDLQLTAIDPDYDDFIRLFKLEERYQQHKRMALHWQEMKFKYTDARIKMMEKSLGHPSFSFTRIKSDIFHNELYESKSMSFQKLRHDMLK